MAGGIVVVAAFGEDPFLAGVGFAQREVIGGNVLVASGKAFFGGGKLVQKGEAQVVLFGGKIDRGETAAEMAGSLPTDLAAHAGFIARALNRAEFAEEREEDGFKEIPIFGPAGEEAAQPKDGVFYLVNIDDGEIAGAAGGDVEAQTKVDS